MEQAIISYFIEKLLDGSGKFLADKIPDIKEQLSKIIKQQSPFNASALLGFGRCGTNICYYVQNKLYEYSLDKLPDKSNAFMNIRNKRKSHKFFFEPLIFALDLDADAYAVIKEKEKKYDKFKCIQLEWPGGAGHVQVIGEYHARKLLSVPPERVKPSDNWKHFFSYFINAVALEINPTRAFFYIFSTGGGTGSGMSTEFGKAQMNAQRQRFLEIKRLAKETKGEQASSCFQNAPLFSKAFGIMPEIPVWDKAQESVHLNTGRLLCKLLSDVEQAEKQKKGKGKLAQSHLPWNCIVLVSNESIARKAKQKGQEGHVKAAEFEQVTNEYVAQQIQNLLSAQLLAGDIPKKDWEKFGIGSDERIRVDTSDLINTLWGINSVAYYQQNIEGSKTLSLDQLFLNSLCPPEIKKTNGKKSKVIQGISLLPIKIAAYEKLFDEASEDVLIQRLSEVAVFKRAKSTLTIISIPNNQYEAKKDEICLLMEYVTRVFPNAKTRRYAIVTTPRSDLSITTFISGNSSCLSTECRLLLASYLSCCFKKEATDIQTLQSLFYEITHPNSDLSITERATKLEALEELLSEREYFDEIVGAPFGHIITPHETSFTMMTGQDVPIEDLALTKKDVTNCIKAMIKLIHYEKEKNLLPEG